MCSQRKRSTLTATMERGDARRLAVPTETGIAPTLSDVWLTRVAAGMATNSSH